MFKRVVIRGDSLRKVRFCLVAEIDVTVSGKLRNLRNEAKSHFAQRITPYHHSLEHDGRLSFLTL
jgi:hypothetical protein